MLFDILEKDLFSILLCDARSLVVTCLNESKFRSRVGTNNPGCNEHLMFLRVGERPLHKQYSRTAAFLYTTNYYLVPGWVHRPCQDTLTRTSLCYSDLKVITGAV